MSRVLVTDLARSGAAVVVDSAEVQLLSVGSDARLHRARRHGAVGRELPREHRWHQHLEREIAKLISPMCMDNGRAERGR